MANMARKRQIDAGEYRREEGDFFAANKNRDGVVSLPNGKGAFSL